MTEAPSAPSTTNTPSSTSSAASGTSARRGVSHTASTIPASAPSTTGSLSILTAKLHIDPSTPETPCVRSSSPASSVVWCRECSGSPVKAASKATQITGASRASAR